MVNILRMYWIMRIYFNIYYMYKIQNKSDRVSKLEYDKYYYHNIYKYRHNKYRKTDIIYYKKVFNKFIVNFD